MRMDVTLKEQDPHISPAQTQATGQHFNLPRHSLDNMKVSVIETINNKSEFYWKNREKHYIEKLNTKYKGLNRNQKR